MWLVIVILSVTMWVVVLGLTLVLTIAASRADEDIERMRVAADSEYEGHSSK